MKRLLSGLALVSLMLVLIAPAEAGTIHVRGYIRKTTSHFVMPHFKTSANKTKLDNFSTKGNYNPYTGKKGYVNPYK